MADTLANVRYRVRQKLGDSAARVVFEPRLDEAIGAGLQYVASELHGALIWSNFLTLVAGTEDYELATTELLEVGLFRLATTGSLVEKVPPELLEAHRENASTTDRGTPRMLMITEEEEATAIDRTTRVRVFPKPRVGEILEGMTLEIPGLPTGASSDVIPLGQFGMRALEYCAAAEIAGTVDDALRSSLNLDAGAVNVFQRKCDAFLSNERRRIARLQRTGVRGRSWRRW